MILGGGSRERPPGRLPSPLLCSGLTQGDQHPHSLPSGHVALEQQVQALDYSQRVGSQSQP